VIALPVNPTDPNAERVIADVQEAARAKAVQLQILKADAEDEFETAFASLVPLQAGALAKAEDAEPNRLSFFSERLDGSGFDDADGPSGGGHGGHFEPCCCEKVLEP
jgi:hypothetical protein